MTTDWNNRLELSVSVSSVARKRQRRSRFIADDVNHLFLLCTLINVVIYSPLQGSCISCWPPQKRGLQVIKLLSIFHCSDRPIREGSRLIFQRSATAQKATAISRRQRGQVWQEAKLSLG